MADLHTTSAGNAPATASRLRRHADYQRAYKASRKQYSASMTFFCAPQSAPAEARVGITAGRVLGNAVERNRIKRRLREAIRANAATLPAGVDVILHPRRSLLTIDYAELRAEVGRIFEKVATSKGAGNRADTTRMTTRTSFAPGPAGTAS